MTPSPSPSPGLTDDSPSYTEHTLDSSAKSARQGRLDFDHGPAGERDDDHDEASSIGRRVRTAVRRLSGGPMKFASQLDDSSVAYGDNDSDEEGYSDGVYGAVINEEIHARRRKMGRHLLLVFIALGMLAAFALVVWSAVADGRAKRSASPGSVEADEPQQQLQPTPGPSFVPTAPPTAAPITAAPISEAPTVAPILVSEARDEPKDNDFPPLLPPDPGLITACSKSSVATPAGRDACQDLCEVAECCFMPDERRALSCAEHHQDDCATYAEICSVLDAVTGGDDAEEQRQEPTDEEADDGSGYANDVAEEAVGLPPLPSDIFQKCSPSSITRDFDACHSICIKSECCYLLTGHSLSCLEGNEYECASYDEACSVLDYYDGNGTGIPLSVEIPPAPSDLADLCSASSLESVEGYVGCHQVCFRAKCCLSDIDTCTVTNPDMCNDYSPCDALPGNQGYSSSGEQPGVMIGEGHVPESTPGEASTGSSIDVEAYGSLSEGMKEDIESKCRTDSLATLGGILECTKECTAAMCCFFTPSDNEGVKKPGGAQSQMGGVVTASCLNHATADWCGQFAACEILLHLDEDDTKDGIDDEEAGDAVEKACGNITKPDETTTCNNVCSPARCCFTDKIDCAEDVKCEHYGGCSVLYGAHQMQNSTEPRLPPEGDTDRERRMRYLRNGIGTKS